MPTPALSPGGRRLDWQGLTVLVAPDGRVEIIRADEAAGSRVCRLGLALDPAWQLDPAVILDDEIEVVGHHPAGVRMVLRHLLGVHWQIRVQFTRDPTGGLPVSLVAPDWLIECEWPPWRSTLGPQAWCLWPLSGPGDEPLLAFVQTRGGCQASRVEGDRVLLALDSSPVEVGSGVRSYSWRWEWTSVAALSARLPAWWPGGTTSAPGEEIRLPLLDAGLVTDLPVSVDDNELVLRPGVGCHRIGVHDPAGVWRLDLAVAPGLDAALRDRADRLVASDPRRAGAAQGFIVQAALACGALSADAARDWLEEVVDRLAGRELLDPLGVEVLVRAVSLSGLDEILPELGGTVLRGEVGAWAAWVSAALLLTSRGLPVPAAPTPLPELAVDATPWQRAEHLLARLEASVFSAEHDRRELSQLAGLLGWGLPGEGLPPGQLARACLVAARFEERAGLIDGVEMSRAVHQRVQELLAGDPDDETLALLIWGGSEAR